MDLWDRRTLTAGEVTMGLIRCPDCETEISDAAPACPKCGRPKDALAPEDAPPVEVTAPARAKALVAIGALMMFAAPVSCTVGTALAGTDALTFAAVLFLGGLAVFVVGRLSA